MVNEHGVEYLSAGELRDQLHGVPDEAIVSLYYRSDHAGFINMISSSFAVEAGLIDHGLGDAGRHIGYEFALKTRGVLDDSQ